MWGSLPALGHFGSVMCVRELGLIGDFELLCSESQTVALSSVRVGREGPSGLAEGQAQSAAAVTASVCVRDVQGSTVSVVCRGGKQSRADTGQHFGCGG